MKVWHVFFSLFFLSNRFHTGREVGDWTSLLEIQKAKEYDLAYQNLRKEAHKEAIYNLMAYQEGQKSHACITNKDAAHDKKQTPKSQMALKSKEIITDLDSSDLDSG